MLEEEVTLERRVTKVLLVWMDSRVHLVLLVRRESQDQEVCQVNLGLRAPKALKDQEEKLAHLAHLERKERWASQVSLDILEEEVPREIEVWLAKEAEMDLLAHPVHLELMVTEESLDPEDPEESEV